MTLRLVESGFTAFPEAGFASFGIVVRNPDPALTAYHAVIHLDFLGPDGAFVAGEEFQVIVFPGQTTALAGQAFGAGEATRMEVVFPEDSSAYQPRGSGRETFEVRDARTRIGNGSYVTTGRLFSRFETAQEFVQVFAIHRDSAGEIIGGATGGIQSIDPGDSSPFEIVDQTPYAGVSTTDVFWQVST